MHVRIRSFGLVLIALTSVAFTCEQRDPDPSLLVPAMGSLVVDAVTSGSEEVDGARVLVDGAVRGRTPLTLALDPGVYSVSVDTSGFVAAPGDTTITIAGNATSAATFDLTPGYRRRVLIEEFTNSGCQGCPEFEALLGLVVDELADEDVLVTSLHTNIPSTSDPMLEANPLELLRRSRIFYAIGGNPSAAIDGVLLPGQPPSEQMVRDSIAAHRRVASPVGLELTFAVADDEITAEVTVRSVADVSGDLRLLLMTTQTEIAFDSPPGVNGQMLFRHVVRDLAPADDGTPIAITAGMNETRTIVAELLTDALPPDDVDRLECVVVLQDWSTRRILQAAHASTAGRPIARPGESR